jgi:SAM-dependent methyltransferase
MPSNPPEGSGNRELLQSETFYLLPRNDDEAVRLYMQHKLMSVIFGDNMMAPHTPPPKRILEVGCGTGHWAIEVAQEYPLSQVIGIDITPPTVNVQHPMYPKNCVFEQRNLFDPLPYIPESFDYIHMRFMSSSIPLARWDEILTKWIHLLQPGGWLEWVETGEEIEPTGPGFQTMFWAWKEVAARHGHEARPGDHLTEVFQRCGYTQVQSTTAEVSIGRHGQGVGHMTALDGVAIFRAFRPLMVSSHVLTDIEADRCEQQMQEELEDFDSPYYPKWAMVATYGQRPLSME